MIHLHGPTYRYQGEILEHPEIIHILDHHYDPESGYALQKLLDNSACDPRHHLLVFDHVLIQDEFSQYQCMCLPLLLAAESCEFNQQDIDVDWGQRTHAFNFMINKARPNRELLLNLIQAHGLTNYRHSLCWAQDYGSIPKTNYEFGDEIKLERAFTLMDHRNSEIYDRLLKQRIFEPTCVSLITEPAYYEKETILTEKTLMAIWAGTLPIWVGGWKCAEYMRSVGFDVFDDIVDHRYQYLDDPRERCSRAVADNIHLLKEPMDLDPLIPRLERNLDLAKKNVFYQSVLEQVSANTDLKCIVKTFRSNSLKFNEF